MPEPLRLGFLGCGNIAQGYATTASAYPEQLAFVGFYDLMPDRAQAMAQKFGGQAFTTVEDLLASDAVDLVVNLTIHTAHFATSKQAIEAGKDVYSEKPIALSFAESNELCELAEAKGVRLAGAPMTFMGETQQTGWKHIRDGKIGTPRLVYAEVNHGRIEAWHPAPGPFYGVGPLWDVGVYPLTLATTFFGPAARVATAYQRVIYPDRETQDGTPFTIETPEFITAVIEMASGPVVRLTTNFFVHRHNTHQKGRFEVHGEKGSLVLGDFQDFHGGAESSDFGEPLDPVQPVREPFEGIEWARSLVEFAEAKAAGQAPRVSGRQASHIVEILEAIDGCANSGKPVELNSSFTQPAPMPWAQ